MRPTVPRRLLLVGVLVGCPLVAALVAERVSAQLSVRPEDPMGLSVRERRIRVVHSSTPEIPGTSMHLQQWDPWMAYQRGRSYFFREWGPEDGVFAKLSNRSAGAATNSCGMCHNLPFPSIGAGGNMIADVGPGLNIPHAFGSGLLESVAIQVRSQILARFDTNRNGYLDVPQETAGGRALIEAVPGVTVDYGSLGDEDGDGRPDLNPVVTIRMVTRDGQRKFFSAEGKPLSLMDPEVVGYDLALGYLGSSLNDHMLPSLRTFASGVYANIIGILTEEPDVEEQPRIGHVARTWGQRSNAGAFLSEMAFVADPYGEPDAARRPTISRGEMDLFEWYAMNHPAPALGRQDDRTRRGRGLMDSLGCTSCHVAEWQILPADDSANLPGDRRFFDLQVAHNPRTDRLEGRLTDLTRTIEAPGGQSFHVPRRDGFRVSGVFTDLVHHDLGPRFRQYNLVGGKIYQTRRFRTPPLWGVGSTAPYGHDGLSPTLDDVIRRHGGEAAASAKAYAEATAPDREAVVAFLNSLIIYIPELLPTDIDGDGKIVDAFQIDGRDVGPEVFRPELLFRVAPRYRGWTTGPDGTRFFSYEMTNVGEAFGEQLAGLVDRDGDSLPDIADPVQFASAAPAGGVPDAK